MGRLGRWASIAILATTAGCASRGPIQLSVERVDPRVAAADLERVDLAFDVSVRNESAEPVSTPTFRYRLDVRGTAVASGEGVPGLQIPGSGPGKFYLPVRIDLRGLREAVKGIEDLRSLEYDLTATFLVPFLGMTLQFPIALKGEFPMVRAPRLTTATFRTSGLTLDGVTVAVGCDLHNPNAFPVTVDGLGYELLLGDTRVGELKASTAGSVGPGETRRIELECRVAGRELALKVLGGAGKDDARIVATGAFATPYGAVNLPR